LGYEGALANLARACDHLHEPAGLAEPVSQDSGLATLERELLLGTHYIE
jgi:hypothetical protein